MNSQTSSRWVVDAALFAVFALAFFLDLTGLDLHQWIGVAAAGLALYHLVTHWNWVTAVTRRFFGKTSGKSRLCYALDAALLAGFAAIAVTGLVISTWLNLPLDNYDVWVTVHVGASMGTLAVTVAKLAVHWRWIVTAGRGLFARPMALPVAQPCPVAPAGRSSARRPVNRRAFLEVMAVIGVPSALALAQAARALRRPLEVATAEEVFEPEVMFVTQVDVPQTAPTREAELNAPAGPQSAAESSAPTATATPVVFDVTATPATRSVIPDADPGGAVTATATAAPAAALEPPAVSCVIRCSKGCSFPGRCRKYADNNGNNKCDLGECL